ncbi:DUF4301 family protein [Flavobacterium rakeshii]|uniref:DUF4301 family protein n=1 Tax=Flavobacterium rakeshii TaxID=1038845 RepID=A0A6N8HGD4_9FLAO|nr:DUF4301 family protein [Flavobacterium rakeshii]MUV04750.1 DUF4301 family protein [Flavobacterium rakeshii]
MEENITKQHTTSITIAIYSNSTVKHEWKNRLTEVFENSTTAFTFHISDFSNPTDGDIAVIVNSEPNKETSRFINNFEKQNKALIVVDSFEEIENLLTELQNTLKLGFTYNDFSQIYSLGITTAKIKSQLNTFKKGISKVVLDRPASVKDGIKALSKKETEDYAAFFNQKKNNLTLKKFVPASGAATRMFKFLNEFLLNFDPVNDTVNAYINKRRDEALKVFLIGADKFPFFKEVLEESKKHPEYSEWTKDERYYNFIKILLTNEKFDFANKPKGILPFHQYDGFTATPIYEHLKESVSYAHSNGKAHVHFTISQEHLDGFIDCIKEVKDDIEKESGIDIDIDFSYQHKQTDTLAVDMNNKPFRDSDGKLFFRPGGHGALIENLNQLQSDVVFIKNIDNVSHNNIKTISLYKKALAGILLELQEKVFGYLKKIEKGNVPANEIDEIFDFAKNGLFLNIPPDVNKYTCEHKIEFLTELLNRPIRICGMVKNEGEPGGGPFWVKSKDGKLSLQIVESSQIDLENKSQNEIFSYSTHFNPVDLVCGLKNYKGEYFDLREYTDPDTGFIVTKNRMGHDVKSYELPGLWNGAMAGWITVFTEVPLDTFNPVKNVNDLLKASHQPNH